MKKRINNKKILFLMMILFLPFFSGRHTEAADISGAKKAIINAYRSYNKTVDVSGYNLYNTTDAAAVNSMMTEIVNETTGLFFADRTFAKIYDESTGKIVRIELGYNSLFKKGGKADVSKIKKVRKQIDKKVNDIIKKVDKSWSDVEKTLFVHDFIISNTEYCDDENDIYATSEWGVFTKNKGNCQGYSLAFGFLMEKLGIKVDYVSSTNMGHMWNIVKISGKWYHVDVTWDDPIDTTLRRNQFGVVFHDNFLRSTKKMKSKGYTGFTSPATGEKYDHAFWINVKSRIWRLKNKWIYQTKSAVRVKKHITTSHGKIKRKVGGNCFVMKTQKLFYFINYNRVYMYNAHTNSIKMLFKGNVKYGGDAVIGQLKCNGNTMTVRLRKNGKIYKDKIKLKKNSILDK